MEYEVVIGLEVHAQLLTQSKMFCGCSADYSSAPPNTHVCSVCLGMPGVLPVINQSAIEKTIMTGLALQCTVPTYSKFDRKNYLYPDLMKGYQISQYDLPLCRDGWLQIETSAGSKRAGITRVHLEEDTARLTHKTDGIEKYTLVDVNRSGVPLMEIVGEPDLRSPEEAGAYLTALREVLQYLGVSSARMDEGAMRCDANISLRPKGADYFNPKVEVKNMNSIRSVVRALEFEIERQTKLLDQGEKPKQETRGWVEEQGVTVSQRSKEDAHDYRYFPEPDLPPLILDEAWLRDLQARLPELAEARRERFTTELGLSDYDARQLTSTKALSDLFEATLAASANREHKRIKAIANWLLGDYLAIGRERGIDIESDPGLQPGQLVELIDLLDAGTINGPTAKLLFAEILGTPRSPGQLVEERGLVQISGGDELSAAVEQVLAANPQAVADYRAGKAQALQFLVGQLMRQTKGRAKPDVARELLEGALAALPA